MLFQFSYQGREYSLTVAALAIATLCASATEIGLVIASWIVEFNPTGPQAIGFVSLVFVLALSAVMAFVGLNLLIVFYETNDTHVQVLQKQWREANGEREPLTEVQQPVYQDTVPLNTARGSRELVLERPLTLAQIELGRALQALFLHAWNTGEDISSAALVGKGKPLSSTEAWGELTDYAHQMGFVSKGNGSKTVLVTTYETAVKGVWGRLSRVSVPVGYKAPKIAPLPQAAWSKIEQSERKAESNIKLSECQ